MPGNRWVAAAAAAPCASPACLPVLRTRPSLAFPMLIPELVFLGLAFPARLLLSASLIAAMGGRAANRLQSEWAAEIYWGVRGDASVIGDLLAGAECPNAGGRRADKERETLEMRVFASEKFRVN